LESSTPCIDCPTDYLEIGDRALGLDGDEHLHLAYAGDYLTHARQDGAGWRVEIVAGAPGSEGVYTSSASLALDADGKAHIGYYDRT
jgi:hypothetical protein